MSSNTNATRGGGAFVQKTPDGRRVLTPEGHDWLQPLVTSTTAQVYAFTGKADSQTIAAAMARLSRSPDDMRAVVAGEFADAKGEKADELLRRVITQYGDDSVQQLDVLMLVAEGVSNILTKMLERPRIAAYLEQSTRYIIYDGKDENGEYRYYVPADLTGDEAETYRRIMDEIFEAYSMIVRRLTEHVRERSPQPEGVDRQAWLATTRAEACDAARPLLPAATTSTIGIVMSAQSLEGLITRLYSEPLHEAHEIADQLLAAARKVAPAFFDRADDPRYGGAFTAYRGETRQGLRDLAKELNHEPDVAVGVGPTVKLLSHSPMVEDELLPDLLFEASEMSSEQISRHVASMTSADKLRLVKKFVGNRQNRRHRPGRAIESSQLKFEVVGDYGSFRDLQRHRMLTIMWQRLTPFLGYDVPNLIVDAGFETEFRKCFDESSRLYKLLVASGFEVEAQYATLLGHKMRYIITMNLREAFHLLELRTQLAGHAGYRKICQMMWREVARVFPTWAAAMIFVNTSEYPEMGRMAAESAASDKLSRLGGTRNEE